MALSTTQYGYIIDPMVPFTDDKGKTIKNGFVRVFVAGSSTPVITYRNFDGAANQDLIELDNSGRTKTSVIGSKGFTYKVCVYDKHHSQESPILTVDKVSVIGANITAGAGATVVTGLDGLTTKPKGFVDASVIGTDGYVALDHTLVTDDLDTDAKVTAVENKRYVPLLNDDVNDPDSKITLGRLWQLVLGKIKSLSTTITAFRTGDVIPVDGPSGTAKMSKDDLLKETAENALAGNVAPVFDATKGYEKNDYVTYENKVYRFKVNHSAGAWNASDVVQSPASYGIGVLEAELNANNSSLSPYATEDRYFLDFNGNKESNEYFSIASFNLQNDEKILHVKCRIGNVAYIWMLDKNGIKIEGIFGNSNPGINFDKDIVLPFGTKYVKVSYITSLGIEVYVPEGIASKLNYANKIAEATNTQIGPLCIGVLKDYYLTDSGSASSLVGFAVNNYDVSSISQVHIECRTGNVSYTWFYDKDGVRISGIAGNPNPGVNFIMDISIPANAVLMRVSHNYSFPCVVSSQEMQETVKRLSGGSDLQGKKIGLIGDSIAAGASASGPARRFINVCAARLGASVDNQAIGGWQYCDHEDTGVYKQVANLSADDDLIVFFAGTNDFGHAADIGDVYTTAADGRRTATTSSYATTTCGGIHKAIEAVYAKYGYKPIVICTPIQRKLAGRDSVGGSWDVNDAGKYLIDYIHAIRDVAEYWGIPVFDAFSINMQPMNDVADADYFDDGLHPNNAGHRLLGESLAKFITTIWVDDTAHSPSP